MIDLKKGAFAPGYLQGWWGNSSNGTERERLRDLTLYPRWKNTTAIYMKIVSLNALLYMLHKFERRHKQGIAESLCDITEGLIYRTARSKRTFPIS